MPGPLERRPPEAEAVADGRPGPAHISNGRLRHGNRNIAKGWIPRTGWKLWKTCGAATQKNTEKKKARSSREKKKIPMKLSRQKTFTLLGTQTDSFAVVSADDSRSYVFMGDGEESTATGFSLVDFHEDASAQVSLDDVVLVDLPVKALDHDEDSSVQDEDEEEEDNVKAEEAVADSCAICLETHKPLIQLMKKCNHPRACYDCLRKHYVLNARAGITGYPLRCFWPGCDRCVRDVQLRRLVTSEEEMTAHYARASMRKQYVSCQKKEFNKIRQQRVEARIRRVQERKLNVRRAQRLWTRVECRHCGHPYGVPLVARDPRKHCRCPECGQFCDVPLPSFDETMSILSSFGADLVNCPHCCTCIVKDGGCNQMTCSVCKSDFYFHVARMVLDRPEAGVTLLGANKGQKTTTPPPLQAYHEAYRDLHRYPAA
jgi:transcription elongation factor Elf1